MHTTEPEGRGVRHFEANRRDQSGDEADPHVFGEAGVASPPEGALTLATGDRKAASPESVVAD